MFKKLRDKIQEEVQQTSLRLPASVQQITQQVRKTQFSIASCLKFAVKLMFAIIIYSSLLLNIE